MFTETLTEGGMMCTKPPVSFSLIPPQPYLAQVPKAKNNARATTWLAYRESDEQKFKQDFQVRLDPALVTLLSKWLNP